MDDKLAAAFARLRTYLGSDAPPGRIGPAQPNGLFGSGWRQFKAQNNVAEVPKDTLSRDPWHWHERAQAAQQREGAPDLHPVSFLPNSGPAGSQGDAPDRTRLIAAANTGAPPDADADGRNVSARRGKGKMTIYTRADGSEDVYTDGTLAWRNNNPGNLQDGAFARRHGAIGSYTVDGRTFAIFPDPQAGERARRALLRGPSYNTLSVDGLIAKYAPPTAKGRKENDTARYQEDVRTAVGVAGTTRIGDLNDDQFEALMGAIHKKEHTTPGRVTRTPAKR